MLRHHLVTGSQVAHRQPPLQLVTRHQRCPHRLGHLLQTLGMPAPYQHTPQVILTARHHRIMGLPRLVFRSLDMGCLPRILVGRCTAFHTCHLATGHHSAFQGHRLRTWLLHWWHSLLRTRLIDMPRTPCGHCDRSCSTAFLQKGQSLDPTHLRHWSVGFVLWSRTCQARGRDGLTNKRRRRAVVIALPTALCSASLRFQLDHPPIPSSAHGDLRRSRRSHSSRARP
mmetsp:Transcript_78776/g.156025  ORF Transcript_78776/g.156025 Transcript_78776/m.156025 type:complete len:227 (-) Transcript_78776:225-905(-)